MTSNVLTASEQAEIVKIKNTAYEVGETMRQLGQLQAFDVMHKMNKVAVVRMATDIKQANKYTGIPYMDEHGVQQTTTNWEEFCKHLIGKTPQQVNEDIKYYKEFGEEFLEANQKIGLGYRDLRQLHKMQPDDRQLLIEQTLEQGLDKEQVKEMIDDLVDQQHLELSKAAKERDDAKADLEASRQTSAEKNQQIDQLKEQLHANRFKRQPWAQATAEVISQLGDLRVQITQLYSNLQTVHDTLLDEGVEFSDDGLTLAMQEFCATTRFVGDLSGNLFAEMMRDCVGYEEKSRPSDEILEAIGINNNMLFFESDVSADDAVGRLFEQGQ